MDTWDRKCKHHPHRTAASDTTCYVKGLQKRVDRRLGLGKYETPRPAPRDPQAPKVPAVVQRGALSLYVWAWDGNTPYEKKP
jgi:hypothetical protein